MTQEAYSSSSSSDYDVFLSYCVKDTGNTFTSYLSQALDDKRTNTFLDRKKLVKGENIFSQLMNAIQGCKIAILVISKNYPSSIWCYIELVKILQCQKERRKNGEDLTILPIFYKVEPSDVGKQKNKLAQAFEKAKDDFVNKFQQVESWEPLRKEMEKVNSWKSWEDLKEKMQEAKWDHWEQFINEMEKMDFWKRVMVVTDENLWSNALQQVVDMEGFKIDSMTMIEADRITEIVGKVPEAVAKTELFHIDKPVGLESHVKDIRKKLNLGSEEIRFLGIVGSGGMGKTTIAKAVYNEICQGFKDRCSFLRMSEEKRDPSEEEKSLVALQNKLVLDVTKKEGKIVDVSNGTQTIKDHLQSKKVLIVVDNVDRTTQLEKLVGARDWFGKGSRIIITSRMKNQLTGRVKEEERYEVKEMKPRDSVRLLSLHVFKQNHPPEDFESVTNEVVEYAQHLPLALVVLSPLLRNQSPNEWNSLLKKWRETPDRGIVKVLETSFKELDRVDQAIFLHISCFFIGHDKDEVIHILDACNLCKESTDARIELLSQKSLLEIKEKRLWMHDMIRDMGREIVRSVHPIPRKRSRLWGKDAIDVWRNRNGTDEVEGFAVDLWSVDKEVQKLQCTTKTFLEMHNLRLLHFDSSLNLSWENCHDHCDPYLFKNLVWICWIRFPFEDIPNNFDLENLVILDMQCSRLNSVRMGTTKHFLNLKVLNLSFSGLLTCLPDFSCVPNLERLILKYCLRLNNFDESIIHLSKLVVLDLSNCYRLKELPDKMNKLASLETLVTCGCKTLKNLPGSIGQLSKLETLTLSGCMSLTSLPDLSNLKHLRELDLSRCPKIIEIEGLDALESVETVKLFGCQELTGFDDKRIFQVLSKGIGNHNICDFFIPVPTKISDLEWPNGSKSWEVGKVPNMKIEGVIIGIVFSVALRMFVNDLRVVIDNQSKKSTWEHKASLANYDDKDSIWFIKIPYCVWEEEIAKCEDIINVSAKSTRHRIQIGVHFYTLQGNSPRIENLESWPEGVFRFKCNTLQP